MPCLCKHKLAALGASSASLAASLSVAAKLPFPSVHASVHALAVAGATQGAGPFSESLIVSLQKLQIPSIALVAGLPTLAGLVNLHVMSKGLGLPLPAAHARLAAMLSATSMASLSPLMALDFAALMKLQAFAAVAIQLKVQLKVDPLSANVAEQVGAAVAAGVGPVGAIHAMVNIPMPPMPPPIVVKLGQIAALHPLISIAIALGINLAEPSGLVQLAATIRALLQIKLPPLTIPLELLARIHAIAQITEAFGTNPSPSTLSVILRLLAALRIPLPSIHAQLGMKQPTPQQVHDVLALNLPALASVSWSIPSTLPLLGVLPALSLAVQLKALGVLQASACSAGCPLGAPGQLI